MKNWYEKYMEAKAEYRAMYEGLTNEQLNNIEMGIEISWPHTESEKIAMEVIEEILKERKN